MHVYSEARPVVFSEITYDVYMMSVLLNPALGFLPVHLRLCAIVNERPPAPLICRQSFGDEQHGTPNHLFFLNTKPRQRVGCQVVIVCIDLPNILQ